MLRVGDVVGGRFRVLESAGAGGFGEVYRAHDDKTATDVAVKVLAATRLDEANRARFERETQFLARLRHPRIVGHVASGVTDAGVPYLAMEWLEGESLAARLSRKALDVAETVRVLRLVAEALAEAHREGIVHRDIKPSNLWLRNRNVHDVVVLDFGVARARDAHGSVTRTGQVLGTPGYIAPEQAWGHREIGPATDVFALGCVAFECLAGVPAFPADEPARMLARVLFDEPPRVRSARADVPRPLADLVDEMLAHEDVHRPRDGRMVIERIDALPAELVGPAPRLRERASPFTSELRLVSLLLATPPVSIGRGEILAHAASVSTTPDGALVARFVHGSASASDEVVRAHEIARTILERCPRTAIALVTGRAPASAMMDDELHDKAKKLVSTSGGPGLVLDDVTSSLLEGRMPSRARSSDLADTDGSRRLLGRPTPCVGRDADLAVLERTWTECASEKSSRMLVVVGEAGIGKSRLRHELLRRLTARGDRPLVLAARGDPMRATEPFAALSDALRSHLESDSRLDSNALRAKIGEHTELVEFVAELVGVSDMPSLETPALLAARRDPRAMHQNVLAACADVIRGLSSTRPVILTLDDLHWADELSIEVCEELARELEDCPFLVVGLARPEVARERPLWRGRAQEIVLRPLSRGASSALVREMLGDRATDDDVERVVDLAAGNALFLEELIRAAHEGRSDEAPATVMAMLQARIGRLPSEARRVLRAASVFGESFVASGLRAVLDVDEKTLAGHLSELAREELVAVRRHERFLGEPLHRFRHSLMRDAALDLLVDEDRRVAHRAAARFLRERNAEAAMIATHLLEAGDAEEAIPWVVAAAERCFFRHDMRGVELLGRKALAAGARGVERGKLLALQAQVLVWKWEWKRAKEVATEALGLLEEGTTSWAYAAYTASHVAAYAGDRRQAIALAERFLAVDWRNLPEERAETAPHVASALAQIGELELASKLLVLVDARDPDTIPESEVTHGRAMNAVIRCTVDRHGRDDLARQIRLSDWATRAFSRMRSEMLLRSVTEDVLGEVLCRAGQRERGLTVLEEAHAKAVASRQSYAVSHARAAMGHGRIVFEDPALDREAGELADALIATPGISLGYEAMARHIKGVVLARGGERASAIQEIDRAIELSGHTPVRKLHMISSRALVVLDHDRAEALRFVHEGLELLDEIGEAGFAELPMRDAAARILLADGHPDAARHQLALARARVLRQNSELPDEEHRRMFLAVPLHRRILESSAKESAA